MNYSLPTLQVFWVIGALERLSTLGFLQQPPLQVSSQAIDFFKDKIIYVTQQLNPPSYNAKFLYELKQKNPEYTIIKEY